MVLKRFVYIHADSFRGDTGKILYKPFILTFVLLYSLIYSNTKVKINGLYIYSGLDITNFILQSDL